MANTSTHKHKQHDCPTPITQSLQIRCHQNSLYTLKNKAFLIRLPLSPARPLKRASKPTRQNMPCNIFTKHAVVHCTQSKYSNTLHSLPQLQDTFVSPVLILVSERSFVLFQNLSSRHLPCLFSLFCLICCFHHHIPKPHNLINNF